MLPDMYKMQMFQFLFVKHLTGETQNAVITVYFPFLCA